MDMTTNTSYTVESFKNALAALADSLDSRGHLFGQRQIMLDAMYGLPEEYNAVIYAADTGTQMIERGPLYHYPDNIKRQICNIRLERLCGSVQDVGTGPRSE